MKLKLVLIFALLSTVSALFAQEAKVDIIFKLKDTLDVRGVRSHSMLNKMERVFPYAPKFEKRHQKHGLHLWYQISATDKQQGRTLLNKLKSLPEVENAEIALPTPTPEYSVTKVAPTQSPATRNKTLANDPLYSKQWHYQNRSYPNGIDINLEKAWSLESGSRDVVVAVMDEGIDISHEDIKANLWTNEAELNGKPGVDDDGNGYIDDIHGYNFHKKTGEINPGNHGTHVAGTIAAVNNNNIGVCGIAGGDGITTGVRVMSCQILKSSASVTKTTTADNPEVENQIALAKAYVYAADMGAVISQNSWTNKPTNTDIIADALNYFMEEAGQLETSPMRGGLVVFAAANDNTSEPAEPHTNPKVNKEKLIIVSSLSPYGTKASYSNYGDWVNISAPGGELGFQKVMSTLANNHYGYQAGTSMACPHVSGIAALVISKFKGKSLTPQEVRRRILTSVNEVDRYNESHAWQNLLGVGIVDAWKALLDNKNIAPSKTTQIKTIHHTPRFVSIGWRMAVDADDQSIDSCRVYWSTEPFTSANRPSTQATLYTGDLSAGAEMVYQTRSLLPNKQYYFAVEGIDRWGNRSELSDVITCRTDENIPVIYGAYRYSTFYLREKETMKLNYEILKPEGMETEIKIYDPASDVQLTETAGGFELQKIATEGSEGIYTMTLIVSDRSNKLSADTLEIVYVINPVVPTKIPIPSLRPGQSANINITQDKGVLSLNLAEYIYDPSGLDFYWRYDDTWNLEMDDFSHGMKAKIDGNNLVIDYEFNLELASWGEPNRIIPVYVYVQNSHLEYNLIDFKLKYTGSLTGIAEEEFETIAVYPSIVNQRLNIRSNETVEMIRIYSMTGALSLEQVNPGASVDVSHLANGNYIVQLISNKGTVVSKISKR